MLQLEYWNNTNHTCSRKIFLEIIDCINLEFATKLLKKLPAEKDHIIQLTLVSDAEIRKMNKRFRNKDAVTDVISLGYTEQKEFPHHDIIGEIFIAFLVAEKQAKKEGHDTQSELQFLFTHGVLHILGFEHATEKGYRNMMGLTEDILQSAL